MGNIRVTMFDGVITSLCDVRMKVSKGVLTVMKG